jgi:hypothetical protein
LMAYKNNPFIDRASERTTSDQEFVRVFSPKILERLGDELFGNLVHVLRSPPGGGKTTLLRAFTPLALKAFWNTREQDDFSESVARLVGVGALTERGGPAVLGVLLSCASGYADLPPGVPVEQEGLFRALLDCRVVLRALRSIGSLLDVGGVEGLQEIELQIAERDALTHIPTHRTALELYKWAERREREVYAYLDAIRPHRDASLMSHSRFEAILWLQDVNFVYRGRVVEIKRLLMIDDVHKLRRQQRALLLAEVPDLRPKLPIWFAERSSALGPQLLSHGAREGRDVQEVHLDQLWGGDRRASHQFFAFAQSILDRRLGSPKSILRGQFSQYLRSDLERDVVEETVSRGISEFWKTVDQYRQSTQYKEWLRLAQETSAAHDLRALETLYRTRILISRDERRKQGRLALEPLPPAELEGRDSSQVQGAAELFIHHELGIPYFFGVERICLLATNNVEELLSIAADMYDALQTKHIVRRETILSAYDQEKIVKQAAERRWSFIPKAHAEGSRTQRLLSGMGAYCRARTYLPNAPYAPGVTGIRLTHTELRRLEEPDGPLRDLVATLRSVLAESVAENLLVCRDTTAAEVPEGTVFYLNRTLCAYFDLPLQYGGWQDVTVTDLLTWMQGQFEKPIADQQRRAVG